MNYRLLLYTLSLIACFHVSLAQDYEEEKLIIDTFLHEEYSENKPGAAVLIAKGDKIIYKKAFGLANVKKKKPLETDMIFQLGSMSKQFTSAAVLQLVEQNKVSLNDKIQQYVDYYPPKEYEITIEHLLSQTSGIPNFFDVDEDELRLLSQEHTPQQLIEYYADQPLLFEPGTQFQYSNSNYPLLGVAVEKVSGLTLEEYLAKNIFQPLGMKSTNLWYREDFKKKRIAQGYRFEDGKFVRSPKVVGSVVYAAGGIVSTVDDLLTWNRALQNRTHLSDTIVKQLTTEKTTTDGTGTGYGYGFFIGELHSYKTVEHGGLLYGFTCDALYIPEEDIFVCVLTNKSRERPEEVADYLASIILGEPINILSKSALNYEEKKEYLGTYQMVDGAKKIIEIKFVDDLVMVYFPKAPGTEVEIKATDDDTFESVTANIEMIFSRDDTGKIVGFTAEQGGTSEWTKIE
ncbi:serine hydrolase domain-containing protein [Tunicatimonas pelagia]|uniref:serine hydrolase domain-containing protein n=1 Tax=Tunicatimonas pelagia TaxID=931531 RepID=UPI0026663C21|nr:serine hydrolase domain-containing protein [Tunicatimonas pelagia]WKN40960.1 serine hydrolase [Tunicatimonas pelagia]